MLRCFYCLLQASEDCSSQLKAFLKLVEFVSNLEKQSEEVCTCMTMDESTGCMMLGNCMCEQLLEWLDGLTILASPFPVHFHFHVYSPSFLSRHRSAETQCQRRTVVVVVHLGITSSLIIHARVQTRPLARSGNDNS